MKEHGMIYQGWGVRAILDDRKTQTRRVILKPERYNHIRECVYCCPYGIERSRLWVREAWAVIWTEYEPDWEYQTAWDVPHRIEYKADSGAKYPGDWPAEDGSDPYCPKWRPSIHMPRWASRITLEITDVRVERVQEISEEDAIAEGIMRWQSERLQREDKGARTDFQALWDSINLKRGYGWETNPWVWVISFKRQVT